jgi:hypothetical protein
MMLGACGRAASEREGEEGGEESGGDRRVCGGGGDAKGGDPVDPGDDSCHDLSDWGGELRCSQAVGGEFGESAVADTPWIILRALFSMSASNAVSPSEKLCRLTFRTRVSPVLTCSTRCTTDSSPKPNVSTKRYMSSSPARKTGTNLD